MRANCATKHFALAPAGDRLRAQIFKGSWRNQRKNIDIVPSKLLNMCVHY